MKKPTKEQAYGYSSYEDDIDDIPAQEPWAAVLGILWHTGQHRHFWETVVSAPVDDKFETHFEKWVSGMDNLPIETRKKLIDLVNSYGQGH